MLQPLFRSVYNKDIGVLTYSGNILCIALEVVHMQSVMTCLDYDVCSMLNHNVPESYGKFHRLVISSCYRLSTMFD